MPSAKFSCGWEQSGQMAFLAPPVTHIWLKVQCLTLWVTDAPYMQSGNVNTTDNRTQVFNGLFPGQPGLARTMSNKTYTSVIINTSLASCHSLPFHLLLNCSISYNPMHQTRSDSYILNLTQPLSSMHNTLYLISHTSFNPITTIFS